MQKCWYHTTYNLLIRPIKFTTISFYEDGQYQIQFNINPSNKYSHIVWDNGNTKNNINNIDRIDGKGNNGNQKSKAQTNSSSHAISHKTEPFLVRYNDQQITLKPNVYQWRIQLNGQTSNNNTNCNLGESYHKQEQQLQMSIKLIHKNNIAVQQLLSIKMGRRFKENVKDRTNNDGMVDYGSVESPKCYQSTLLIFRSDGYFSKLSLLAVVSRINTISNSSMSLIKYIKLKQQGKEKEGNGKRSDNYKDNINQKNSYSNKTHKKGMNSKNSRNVVNNKNNPPTNFLTQHQPPTTTNQIISDQNMIPIQECSPRIDLMSSTQSPTQQCSNHMAQLIIQEQAQINYIDIKGSDLGVNNDKRGTGNTGDSNSNSVLLQLQNNGLQIRKYVIEEPIQHYQRYEQRVRELYILTTLDGYLFEM